MKESDDELQREMQALHSSIYRIECFNTKDLIRYHLIGAELAKRGIRAIEHSHLLFKK